MVNAFVPELTVKGFWCEVALPLTVEDWNALFTPPMGWGSAKLTLQGVCGIQKRVAGVV
jgi:hypothetical protein